MPQKPVTTPTKLAETKKTLNQTATTATKPKITFIYLPNALE